MRFFPPLLFIARCVP
uniref:Uncharacterized protein n=1 Tax=Anopheles arabiensis TaxID=7173 RepID=A0A182IGK0_ANOAR